jgi:hypothetical protein
LHGISRVKLSAVSTRATTPPPTLPAGTTAAPAGTTAARPRTDTRRRRRSPGWVPNQHGAWAMLAVPLLVGVLAGHPAWVHLPLAIFWVVGYFLFFATGLWLKSARKARYLPPVRAYALVAVPPAVAVLALRPELVRWAPLFVPPMLVGLVASARRNDRALVSGLATTVGSCLMAVVAYDAGGGTDVRRAWLVAAVLAAYFSGTVFYVKNLIRERGSERHWWMSVGFHGLMTLAMIAVSPWLVALFAVLTIRAAVVPAFGPTPKQAGTAEILATALVAVAALLAV